MEVKSNKKETRYFFGSNEQVQRVQKKKEKLENLKQKKERTCCPSFISAYTWHSQVSHKSTLTMWIVQRHFNARHKQNERLNMSVRFWVPDKC